MNVIIYGWLIKLKSGPPEKIAASKPAISSSEVVFPLEGGGEKRYKKEEVVSFVPTGFRPFII